MTSITETLCGCGRSKPIRFDEIAVDVPCGLDAAWEMPVCDPGPATRQLPRDGREGDGVLALMLLPSLINVWP